MSASDELVIGIPCPICGKRVLLEAVTEWATNGGEILAAEFGCETEPDIEGDGWWEWFHGHYRTPYIDWLPWSDRALRWLNRRFLADGRGWVTHRKPAAVLERHHGGRGS